MRKFLLLCLVIISIEGFAQPTNYIWYKQRTRQYSMMIDSMLFVPRYNGTPSGVRVGENSAIDGAVAVDTANNRFYIRSGGAWVRVGNYSEIPAGLQPVLAAGRTLSSNDSILFGGYVFKFKGGELIISSDGVDNGDYTLQNTGGAYFDVTGKNLKLLGIEAGEIDSVYGKNAAGNVGLISVDDLPGGGGGGGSPAGNYGNVQLNINGVLGSPASDSLDFDGGLSIKGTLKVDSLGSGSNSDSAVTYNTSTNLFNKKRATVINIASRDSGDIIQWNGTENVYVPKPTGATNLIGTIRFTSGTTADAPPPGDSLLTNTGLVNKYVFVYRNGLRQDSSTTDGYTFTRSTGVLKFKPVLDTGDVVQVDVYDTLSVYRIALETIVQPSVDLDLAANRSNLTKTGTVFTPTANNTTFDAYGQDALKIPSGQSGRFYSQYVTSGDNTYMLFVNTSSSFLPYSNANSHGLYVNGSNQIQPLDSGTPGSSVGSVTAGSWYGIYRDIGAGNIRIQSSTDGVSWTDVATLSAYSSADLYLSIVIYSTSGKKVSNPKGQGVL